MIADGDIESQKNVTAGAAVIGQRIFAYDTTNDGYGGVIGSWDTVTAKGAGFRYNGNLAVPTMEFGAVDPATGTMPSWCSHYRMQVTLVRQARLRLQRASLSDRTPI